MNGIEWCKKQKSGLKIVEESDNLARSYLDMAEKTINEFENMKTNIWKRTAVYYIYYYSLYAFMRKIGVKCEIHSCSIEFARKFLRDYYSDLEIDEIEDAFEERTKAQYYPSEENLKEAIKLKAVDFYVKTKEMINKISEDEINKIKEALNENKN